jgi:organic hydroperoxide reductase OsmC/OhrA
MAEHKATINWEGAAPEDFLKGRFSREHNWTFDGGLTVPASAAPAVVPAPMSNPAAVDPEEAFVASLASCHMLTFLFLAYRKGVQVTAYRDEAVGVMDKAENGVPWVRQITLHPTIAYGGEKQPTREEERELHQQAHRYCFIANSVKTRVVVSGFENAPA